jgi:hypothetical protein
VQREIESHPDKDVVPNPPICERPLICQGNTIAPRAKRALQSYNNAQNANYRCKVRLAITGQEKSWNCHKARPNLL